MYQKNIGIHSKNNFRTQKTSDYHENYRKKDRPIRCRSLHRTVRVSYYPANKPITDECLPVPQAHAAAPDPYGLQVQIPHLP